MQRFPFEAWCKAHPLPKSIKAVCKWVWDAAFFRLRDCNESDVDQIVDDIQFLVSGNLRRKDVDAIVRSLPECSPAEQKAIREEASRETIIKNFIRPNRGGKGEE